MQVVAKLLKHAKEVASSSAHGLLLGLDLDGTLEISNSFPMPHHGGDEDEKSAKSVGELMISSDRRFFNNNEWCM